MEDQLIILLTSILVLLSIIVGAFLIALTVFLVTLKRTLEKLQLAIENVEDTAIRSLAPLLSFRAIFSDINGFMNAMRSISGAVIGKKSSRRPPASER